MLIALLVATLALLGLALGLPRAFTAPPAFWAHLVLAVGVMSLITAAMQHFVPVLTRSRGASPAMERLPLLMMAAGGVAALTFLGLLHWHAVSAAAFVGLVGAGVMIVWMLRKGRASLGRPHACLDWYVAAMGCLALGLLAAMAIPLLPEWHRELRAFHIHLNLYGFIGLTAVGTLQVLLPTAAGVPDPEVAARLRTDLKWALAGTLCLALGKAAWLPLAWANILAVWLGAALWAWPLLRLLAAWWRLCKARLFALHGAEPVLTVALLGFMMALAGTVVDRESLGPLTIFLPGFLFPLVTGAAGQLAPVWTRPGQATPWHEASRRKLTRWSGVRGLFFLTAALLPLLGYRCAGIPALIALFWFGAVFVIWLFREE